MIEIVDTIEKMNNLRGDWQQLAQSFESPLLQFDWFLTCAKTLHNERDLHIVVLKSNTGLILAIAPLVIQRHRVTKWLEILGTAVLHEPSGLLYDSLESLELLLAGIVASGIPVNLSRLSSNSPAIPIVQRDIHRRGILITRPTVGSYYITTTTEWEPFFASVGKKWRSDFRNKRHRAEKIGELKIEIFCPDSQHLEQSMEKVMAIEAMSWKGRQGSSILDNKLLKNFFLNYAAYACKSGILRICFLSINDTAIAMNLGVEFANRLWFYKTGYDEKWSRVSPGMQLSLETIKYACSKNLASYEFLGSEEAWQRAWPVSSHKYCSLIILPFTLKGVLGLADIVLEYARNRLATKFKFLKKLILKNSK